MASLNKKLLLQDGFFYAQQLQTMASANVSAVVRQDLLGMFYQLLSCAFLLLLRPCSAAC